MANSKEILMYTCAVGGALGALGAHIADTDTVNNFLSLIYSAADLNYYRRV